MAGELEVITPSRLHTLHELRTTTGDGRDMVVMSGYVEVNGEDLRGNPDGSWNRKELRFRIGPQWVRGAVDSVPVVSMTSIMNRSVANNAGWAVDQCELTYFELFPPPPIGVQLELRCRVAVRDSDGYMFRVNYYSISVGRLATASDFPDKVEART